jgi:hypothetical protein
MKTKWINYETALAKRLESRMISKSGEFRGLKICDFEVDK